MARPPIHSLFSAALSATPDYVRNAPIHLGGPQPMVPRIEQNEIVRWCAELLLPFIHGSSAPGVASRDVFADLIAQARSLGPKTSAESRQELERALNVLGTNTQNDDPLSLAPFVASTVKREELRNVVRTARSTVARTARILALNHMPPEYFLDQLDDRLMRAELVGCARGRCKDITERVDAIAYRGGNVNGDTTVIVARIRPRADSARGRAAAGEPVRANEEERANNASAMSWGALVRNIGFHWSEGSVNEALAIVPEDHLERAAAAAFA